MDLHPGLARHGRWLVHTLDGRKPPDARADNLDLVARPLGAAGVEYFVVRRPGVGRSAIAVRAEARRKALEAVKRALDDVAAYCTVVIPAPADGQRPRLVTEVPIAELAPAQIVRFWRNFGDEPGGLVYRDRYACDVEFWDRSADRPGHLAAPRPNDISTSIPEEELEPVWVEVLGATRPTARAFTRTAIDDITFPVDAVYTWVDGDDPAWRARRDAAAEGVTQHPEALASYRFRSRDELRYSLRSLDMYAPWIRHVFVVTDRQVPDFLDPAVEGLTIVDHREIAPGPEYLPVFNSSAITTWLHRVPGLGEHYLYLNDDVFFGRDTAPSLFFHPSGVVKVFPSSTMRPLGPPDPDDLLPVNKARNIRHLLERDFGRSVVRAIKHTPHAQLRSVHEELAARYQQEYERTSRSRFRRDTDVPADQLFHYYAQLTGRATVDRIAYRYVRLGNPAHGDVLGNLLSRRDQDVFCINDTPADPGGPIPDAEVAAFLERYFPVPSRWELPGG
jgi:hypothetical protein